MLYHYYMKINFQRFLAACAAVCVFSCAWAQVSVVKQEGDRIYLDTSELNRNVSVGESFKVILSSEKLVNPKTGRDLGRINRYSQEGKIVETQPLYAVGEMPGAPKFSVGQEAVITFAPSAAPVSAPAVQTAEAFPAGEKSSRKMNTYPVVEREIVGAVKADFNALPGEEIAAADTKGNLVVYAQDGVELRETAVYKLPSGRKTVSVSAADVTGAGRAQAFVSVYDERKQQVSTLVFDVSDREPVLLGTLPYLVKELGCGSDKKLYAQKAFANGNKASDARELVYKDGRFSAGKKIFSAYGNRLSGVQYYPVQKAGEHNFVYTASNGRLRVRLDDGKYAQSPARFASAPNRVKYKQDILSFYPSVQVYGPAGRATLAGVENTAKLGALSEQFGQYDGGKIHFLTYENGALNIRETVQLNGFVYDTSCTSGGILAPQILPGGRTLLVEIYR